MPSLSGYGTYDGVISGGSISSTTDTAAEAFLTDGLSKVLKINNICDATHLADCGIPTTYTNMAGSTKTFPTKLSEMNTSFLYTNNPQKNIDTKAAAFETQNGESIAVFYNPYCQPNLGERWHYAQPKMCANFIYDLNGKKGPNVAGKDIGFITALYSSDPVIVSPQPITSNGTNPYPTEMSPATGMIGQYAAAACAALDSESRVPNIDELSAMFFNRDLFGILDTPYWSSTKESASLQWIQFEDGNRGPSTSYQYFYDVRCIKR